MPMDFEEVVQLHYPSLYRFAFSLARQESEACDLTQQTFYIWAGKQGQLRDKTKVKSWLFTTLHREFLARQRKITRFPQIDLDEPGVDGGHPHAAGGKAPAHESYPDDAPA